MNRILYLVVALITVVSFTACQTGGGDADANYDGYIISGKVENAPANTKIFLDDLQRGRNGVIDTATVKADGTFEMRGKLQEPTIGQLRFGMNKVFLILENEKIDFDMNAQVPNEYSIAGSADNVIWKNIFDKLRNRQATPQYLTAVADTADNVLLGYLALNQTKIEDQYEAYKKFSARMAKEMPNAKLTKDFQTRVQQAAALAQLSVGKSAPDIKLPNPDGNDMALSELRGQVVLLDFWASWCRPCRRENPTVVAAYDKYKEKGFTVFSVSLDQTAPKWVAAIEQDNLKWDGHVSDLKGWGSSASALYGVRSIPQTFLIGRDGNIVAKNLRGSALERKLAELLEEA